MTTGSVRFEFGSIPISIQNAVIATRFLRSYGRFGLARIMTAVCGRIRIKLPGNVSFDELSESRSCPARRDCYREPLAAASDVSGRRGEPKRQLRLEDGS